MKLLFLGALCLAGCAPQTQAQNAATLVRDGQKIGDFPTIQSAIEAARAGDAVQIRGGRHHESLRIENRSGAAQKPLVLESAPGETAILDGATSPTAIAWTPQGDGVFFAALPWNGDAKLAKDAWCSAPSQLLWAYSTKAEFDIGANGEGSFREPNGVWIRLAPGRAPHEISIRVPTQSSAIALSGDARNWLIRNLRIENAGVWGVKFSGAGVQNVTLQNLEVRNTQNGISTGSIWDEPSFGREISVENCRILNDWNDAWIWHYFYEAEPGNRTDAGAMRGAGIQIHASDSSVKSCTVSGQHDGMAVSGRNLEVAFNSISRIHDDALEVEGRVQKGFDGAINTRIFGNWIEDCYVGISLGSLAPGPVYVYRNTLVNNRAVQFKQGSRPSVNTAFKTGKHGWGDSVGWRIYHNTVYSEGGLLNADWVGEGNNAVRDVAWLNNIFITRSGAIARRTGLAKNGVCFDGNLYFRAEKSSRALWEDWNGLGAQTDLGSARGAFGDWEENGVQADPLLQKIGAKTREGWGLQSQSPARDAGVVLPQEWPDLPVVKDGKPDIGAHEWSAPTA